MMDFINDRRVGRGQAPLDFDDNLIHEYQDEKRYRCDPDLISAALLFQDKKCHKDNEFYIDQIKALSFKHDTWGIESDTSRSYAEGVDVLEENAASAILLEQEENLNSKEAKNIVPSQMTVENNNSIEKMEIVNSELVNKIRELKGEIETLKNENIRYEKVKNEKNNLIEKMEIVNSKLLKENRELKDEIESLKYENIKYEKIKDVHEQISELLRRC